VFNPLSARVPAKPAGRCSGITALGSHLVVRVAGSVAVSTLVIVCHVTSHQLHQYMTAWNWEPRAYRQRRGMIHLQEENIDVKIVAYLLKVQSGVQTS
jgi:hypothetical protein